MFAVQMTCHTNEKQCQWHQNQLQEGVISNFGTELEFMCSQSQPRSEYRYPELAFAIRLKVGSHAAGIFTPTNTVIVARTGAHTTGSFAAEINALRLLFFLPSAPEEGFSKYRPIGIVIALTIIEIIATTKPVDTESP